MLKSKFFTILFVVEAENILPQRGHETMVPIGALAPVFLTRQQPIYGI